jgi:LmbE family N-acetylglucosaminyl deacetylase
MRLITKLGGGWCIGLACLMNWCPSARAYDWQPPPNKITLLAVFAHPDDEGIFGGGALPYYSSVLNLPTMLLCMADGNETLRQDELRCAAWSYGLRYEPLFGHFANFLSSWITNSPYTNSIDVTWDLWADGVFQGDGSDVEAGKTRAINCVAEAIRRYRPDVIITHDVNGETGHDNHKATAYAVMHAFFVAADPTATATNLVGLPPWQAQKLYVHLYPTNKLFHKSWEIPYPALTNLTAHQAVNIGLSCHVSQGPSRWVSASVYPPGGNYTAWPAEWWGLYASMVGPDTVLSSNAMVNGYGVESGVAAGDFLEHLTISELYFNAVPHSATVRADSSVTLSALAATTGSPLSYQWQFNGANIAGATAASLMLSNVQPAAAGSYTVLVTNMTGSLTSPAAVLTVLLPPAINAHPQTRTNLVGTAATFSATASGSGPLHYQWVLNGVELHDDGNIRGATTPILQIGNVQSVDAGNLVLAVSNTVGVAAASVGTLVVQTPPPCVPVPPGLVAWWLGEGDASDLAGTNNGALLGGATASAAGKVGLAFSFDGTNSFIQIPDSPQLNPSSLTVEAWVLFSALDSDGAGGSPPGQQYIVFKQNSLNGYLEGYSLSKARTDGGDVFSFTISSGSGQVLSLQSATLVATGVWYHVAGVRGPDFTQLYVNGQLESQTNANFPQDYGTNALFFGSSGQASWDHKFAGMLDEVSLYDRALAAGEIAAIYAAGAGGKCQEATITAPPQSQTVLVGSNATFVVTVAGPALSYQWFFNGTNALASATNSTLSMTNLTLSQSGSYSVVASNYVGAVFSPAATLTVAPIQGIVMPITLSGSVGSSWRIDYINDLGTNNWATLTMVTLTNLSQVYLDTSALSQPQRFYRVVPLP